MHETKSLVAAVAVWNKVVFSRSKYTLIAIVRSHNIDKEVPDAALNIQYRLLKVENEEDGESYTRYV